MNKYDSMDYKIIRYTLDENVSLDSNLREKCYVWGYADGFYHEKLYKKNIVDSDMMHIYNSGYFDGKENRECLQNKDYELWKKKKITLLNLVASNDGRNGFEMREVSEEYNSIYTQRYNEIHDAFVKYADHSR